MKYFAVLTIVLTCLVAGCAKSQPEPVQAPPVVEQQPQQAPVERHRYYSPSYMRGYHDGYNGNWLAPVSWLLATEYRAGWSAGERDRLSGSPNRFED